MKELFVIVAGKTNTGKSTVVEAIRCALAAHGFDVQVDDMDRRLMDDDALSGWLLHQEKRLKALEEKGLKVTIRHQQLARQPGQVLRLVMDNEGVTREE